MKAKLIKVITETKTHFWNYGDDYSDITRHIVSDHSDWEELTESDISDLRNFLETANTQRQGFYYALILEDQPVTCKMLIDDIVGARQKAIEEEKRKNKIRLEEEKERKAQAAIKKREKLEKQLKKLQEQLS